MNNIKKPYQILVIEDNILDFIIVEDLLTERLHDPIKLVNATNFKDAAAILRSKDVEFDAVLLDLTLPDKTGQDLIREILILTGSSPVIILTGYSDIAFSIISISLGVSDYLIKDNLNASELYKSILYSIERKKITSLLEESEKRYSNLFNLSPQPMWVYSLTSFKFLDVNVSAIKMYGYDRHEFLTMKLQDLNSTDDISPAKDKEIKPASMLQSHFRGNLRHQKKTGELINVKYYGNNITFKGEKAEIGISVDVTESSNYINTIQNQNIQLRDIAWIQSHIVRAPLARILGVIDLIKNLGLVEGDIMPLIDMLSISASELDAAIKNIVTKTEIAYGAESFGIRR